MLYISLDNAIEIHALTVEKSGGGTLGQIDISRLETILESIQNDDYYPTFLDKITHLCFATCNCHSFMDGNKRIALTLSLYFMIINGYAFATDGFIRHMENVILNLAASKISKELLREIFEAILNADFPNEYIQLKIFEAIQEN